MLESLIHSISFIPHFSKVCFVTGYVELRILHIHNICIARSNLVSLRNLDVHLLGQVQVIDEKRSMVVLYILLHISPFSFLLPFFFETRYEYYLSFVFFLGERSTCFVTTLHGLELMDVYVSDPIEMNRSKFPWRH